MVLFLHLVKKLPWHHLTYLLKWPPHERLGLLQYKCPRNYKLCSSSILLMWSCWLWWLAWQCQGKAIDSFLVQWRCHQRLKRSLETMPLAVLSKLWNLGVYIPTAWQCWFYPVAMPIDPDHTSCSVTISLISQTSGVA